MWLLGHTALAYLVLRFLFFRKGKEPEAYQIFYLLVFANILDAMHFGSFLRTLTHSLAGAVLFPLAWILFFRRCGTFTREDGPLMFAAALLHVVGDLLFAGFSPFFPLASGSYTLFPWNGFLDQTVEGVLGVVFLVILVRSGDLKKLRQTVPREKERFFTTYKAGKSYFPVLFTFFLVFLFWAFAVGQFFYSLALNHSRLLEGLAWSWFFTMIFVILLLVLTTSLRHNTGRKPWLTA